MLIMHYLIFFSVRFIGGGGQRLLGQGQGNCIYTDVMISSHSLRASCRRYRIFNGIYVYVQTSTASNSWSVSCGS